ncbi:MAG: protein phosphatase 2C domain-containing protein [Gemmatimonadales bacterium]
MKDSAISVRPSDDELDLFGITHRGIVRPDNQDHFLIATVHPQLVIHGTSLEKTEGLPLRGTRLATVMLLADGVGGAAAGSEAARLAAESVTRYVSSTLRSYHAAGTASDDDEFLEALKSAALEAHSAVRAEAALRTDQRQMATTLTVGFAVWPWLYVVQVGDSRCYYFSGGKLRQITRDQTVAQALVDQGIMPKDRLDRSPLKHVLSSAIGAEEAMPEVTRINISARGLIILICTDGLTKHVTDDEIADSARNMKSSEQIAKDLLDLALSRGGTDNITIIAARALLKT